MGDMTAAAELGFQVTWAMMIGGFALAGAVGRRRPTAVASLA